MKQSEIKGYGDSISLDCISFHRGYACFVSQPRLLCMVGQITTFQKLVEQGTYSQDWGGGMEEALTYED